MQAGWVQGLNRGPTGPAKRVLGFAQDGNQTQAERTKSRVWIQTERLGDLERKGKESVSHLSLGPGVFIEDNCLVHLSSQVKSRNKGLMCRCPP